MGNALKKKVGPFPVWLLAVVGIIVAWWLYRRASGASGSSGAAVQTQTTSAQAPASPLGDATQAGAPADTGQTTSDLIAALGGEREDLLGALLATQQNVADLATAQISYAQAQTSMGSFNTQTQPAVASDPGGGNTPIYVYVAPTVNPASAASHPAVTTVTGAKQTGASTRYYTYKRDVPLGQNQTVHFLTNRGYFAYG